MNFISEQELEPKLEQQKFVYLMKQNVELHLHCFFQLRK